MGKKIITRIKTDGTIAKVGEKKTENELKITYDREAGSIKVDSYEKATKEQCETAIIKIREHLESRMSIAGDTTTKPEIKAENYQLNIDLPICALTRYQVDSLSSLAVDGLDGAAFDKIIPKNKPKMKKPKADPPATTDDAGTASDTSDTTSDSGAADTASDTSSAADTSTDSATADSTSDATTSTDDASTTASDDAADTRSASDDSSSDDSDTSDPKDSSKDESHKHPGHDDCHDPGDWYWNTPIDAKAIAAEFDKIG